MYLLLMMTRGRLDLVVRSLVRFLWVMRLQMTVLYTEINGKRGLMRAKGIFRFTKDRTLAFYSTLFCVLSRC
jgi:hypothetical protein